MSIMDQARQAEKHEGKMMTGSGDRHPLLLLIIKMITYTQLCCCSPLFFLVLK